MVCKCEDCGNSFRPENGDDKRHVHRDDLGMLWRFCYFCLELARLEDRARRALQEFDGPIRTSFKNATVGDVVEWRGEMYRVVRDVTVERVDRPNTWGEDE